MFNINEGARLILYVYDDDEEEEELHSPDQGACLRYTMSGNPQMRGRV